ncbi:MAG: hypothetical protein NPIRA01_31360 [Nitrospirales bacterium]|nr:MAG: hypothetical protein NPIRA01_31360 [Nitrospirales bacterium]
MSHNPTEQPVHPDELLPWLVNGTLSGSERHDVEQHLEFCTQCQQEIALLEQMRTEIKESSTSSPGEIGLNRLLNKIQNEQTAPDAASGTHTSVWRTGLAIAASLIIFIQAGLLLDSWYLSKPMVPLAGPQTYGLVLQVSFVPTATEAQIREVITGVHATFIDGPSSLGLYRIRLDPLTANESSIPKTIEQLRQHTTIIQHVAKN